MKKIRPSHKYTYLTFLILFIFLSGLIWCICGTRSWDYHGDYVKDRLWVELTYIGSSFIFCLLGAIIYRIKVYYIINDQMIIRHGKIIREYHFRDIVYLDEEYTSKHNDMMIYINTGKWVSLTMDPKKEIYHLIKERSSLLSKDQLIDKYPESMSQKARRK